MGRNPIVGAILLACLLVAAGAWAEPVVLDRVVAVVNQDAITWSELYGAMKAELDAKPEAASMTPEQRMTIYGKLEQRFLGEMIDERLQMQAAGRMGISASERDVDSYVRNMGERFGITELELYASVEAQGIPREEYRRRIGEQILVQKVVDREVMSKVSVTEEDVRRYLEAEGLQDGSLYMLSQIYVKVPKDGMDEATRAKVDAISEGIRQGEDFTRLALRYSDDPSVRRNGGNMGRMRRRDLAPEIERVLTVLSPGSASGAIETPIGVFFIQLMGVMTAEDVLRERQFDARQREWMDSLRDEAFIEVKL